ncbi:similar to Saccharomyces cerevisiae YLR389C STE23 Metalloprotease involved, with homolog Axl1p, in N-terminal processing of pro-a-factor to the mature form [Maudiozyma barnettii]|uniref:Similar to Saccharomyces cerevisiae YLR389C STE23 Metalloprotease involved, with homolog Axl1p, in N-terminal processing of pro-a-factor to the mature form n=1 Tax=Maudiozyma barnettii TaxID=61262 RepID=A0A8H2VIQ4_9SACH|nr:metalloendopeptidase [Kazachstania barnettii]CAB4256161.1 similar to Saccharomyces cerevisiae YLR389C STE23 Metalloprotease involved, with homolog Axl1p, in N-terminal processing of pro-a-factor to the mature form [Kazachstania barnettii]CAD1784769.1 similar to Saccharomyces cerevisiae YLR389C STE23 Metalloprotease involved, with homolog Axl1p, in N-terminal processing of pro-a-factor to the mature form [Kazachstania barnettii]
MSIASLSRNLPHVARSYTTLLPKYNPLRTMATYKILNETFEKPDLDDRQYRFIQLPNNLQALLIHDPTTDKAAAALDVNIGAFEDPEELPGLAHFCEHLLFMGSEKFPDENEYSSYLSKHGGSSNAYTGSQNTNYYFEINNEHLFNGLDRFSGFFTGPLFNKDSTDKEINAVDSENKKNLQNDVWRIYQLDKYLSNHEHPYHKFSTGNVETLGTIPTSQGLNIRDELLKFYNRCYSANLMKLCILGREDLDTLSDWATQLFQDVPTTDREVPEYPTQVITKDHFTKIIRIKPVKDIRKLEVTFLVPDMDEHWESKPSHFLSHLIGHEGSGSLLAYLKKLGWANELSAGGLSVSKDNSYFSINIDLTEKGMDNYINVVHIIFQYIEHLKNALPQDWIYTELANISKANFKFKQKGSPSSTVSNLAKKLSKDYIPVENILNSGIFTKNEPEKIIEFTKSLTVENSRFMLISRDLPTDTEEKWYGTEYSIIDYPEELLKLTETPGLKSSLHLPHPNEFVANNFTVDKQEDIVPLNEPYLLQDNENGKLWYKKDDRFWQPRGYIYISLKLPHTHASILTSMLSTLYVQLVNDSLKDLEYDAACANLRVSFVKISQGLDITLTGFNEKLATLLTRFLDGIKNFMADKDRFEVFKDKTVQHLDNLMYEVPYGQMYTIYNSLSSEISWSTKEKLDVAKQLTFEQFQAFIPTIFQEMYSEILVHGNLKYEEAMEIDSLIDILRKHSVQTSQVDNIRMRSYIIPNAKTFRYETLLTDKKNVNSCIQHVTQLDVYTEGLSAMSGLFAQMIHEPCFNILRTKEQLGYVVFSSSLNNHGTANIRILVQSEHSTPFLEWRIDEFYKKFGNILTTMTEKNFKKHKNALCKNLLQKYKNMNEESSRYTAAIYLGDYNFLHRQKKAELVEALTKEQMIAFYERYINGPDATKLVIHLKSQAENKKVDSEKDLDNALYPSGILIDDIRQFKSASFLAPIRQPSRKFEIYDPNK